MEKKAKWPPHKCARTHYCSLCKKDYCSVCSVRGCDKGDYRSKKLARSVLHQMLNGRLVTALSQTGL